MGDDVLDAIIFMQQYYKNNESNSQVSETPKTPNIENNKIRHNTPGTSRYQSRMNQATIITTPEIRKNDPNTTISADPAVMKRGRIEYDSAKGMKSTKKSKPDITNIVHVESDEDVDLDQTQIQIDSNEKFGSQATPRNRNTHSHVIKCTPGNSRAQAPETPKTSRSGIRTSRSQSSRGSMFQAPQTNNSVFTFRSRTTDANQTISADPAIKKRGPVKDFNDTFIDDSDIL